MPELKKIRVLEEPFPPTPIVRLSGDYSDNEIWIKREDLIPFSFGGNKARKAAYFYREIQKEQPDVIMTYGSNSSNHCRIIANLAASLGTSCHIISSGEEEHGTNGRELFNRVLVKDFGASVETVPVEQVHDTIERRLQEYREQGRRPYFIQGGGHGNAGTQSYVDAFREIVRQEEEAGIRFNEIFHATGTGSTQAGLVCGKELEERSVKHSGFGCSGEKWEKAGSSEDRESGPEEEKASGKDSGEREYNRIVGISIARPCPRGREVVRESILDYYRELSEKHPGAAVPEFREEDLVFADEYRLGGYGKAAPEEEDCIRRVMRKEGIPMDTTYVGKAFFGMLQYLRDHGIRNERILFLHTGGTPLFFDKL